MMPSDEWAYNIKIDIMIYKSIYDIIYDYIYKS